MEMIKVKTRALKYIKTAYIITEQYENGALYVGLYDTREQELYTDISTYIIPVLPGLLYVEKGTEQEKFVQEQKAFFTCLNDTIKSGFNTYILYRYLGKTERTVSKNEN